MCAMTSKAAVPSITRYVQSVFLALLDAEGSVKRGSGCLLDVAFAAAAAVALAAPVPLPPAICKPGSAAGKATSFLWSSCSRCEQQEAGPWDQRCHAWDYGVSQQHPTAHSSCHQRRQARKDESGSSAQHRKVGAVCFWLLPLLKLSEKREKLLTCCGICRCSCGRVSRARSASACSVQAKVSSRQSHKLLTVIVPRSCCEQQEAAPWDQRCHAWDCGVSQ